MKKVLFSLLLTLSILDGYGQNRFQLPDTIDKVSIPFELIYNLMIIPVNLNGSDLNLIVDTGASRSFIFNLEGVDLLNIHKGPILKIAGYGKREPFKVFNSKENELNINGLKSANYDLFIMADQSIDLSGFFGMRVHGLIGYDFFRDHIIEMDYQNQLIHVHRAGSIKKRKLRRMTQIPVEIKNRKPYIQTLIENNELEMNMNTLIDTGNGDALWLLPPIKQSIKSDKGFVDKLGVGLSGNVIGFRSKMNHVTIGKYKLNDVTVSIPENESLANRNNNPPELEIYNGSVGAQVLKRFRVYFDYKNEVMYLKPKTNLRDGFYYNMAGLELMEGDLEIFTDYQNVTSTIKTKGVTIRKNDYDASYRQQKTYTIQSKILISNVRPGSLAEVSGIRRGDVVLRVNGKTRKNLTQNKISRKFFEKPYSHLRFVVQRDDKILKFKFQLVPLM